MEPPHLSQVFQGVQSTHTYHQTSKQQLNTKTTKYELKLEKGKKEYKEKQKMSCIPVSAVFHQLWNQYCTHETLTKQKPLPNFLILQKVQGIKDLQSQKHYVHTIHTPCTRTLTHKTTTLSKREINNNMEYSMAHGGFTNKSPTPNTNTNIYTNNTIYPATTNPVSNTQNAPMIGVHQI